MFTIHFHGLYDMLCIFLRYGTDVDKEMVLLRVEAEDGTPLGSVNWFPVHPTSMNNTNKLISGDNKGYASMQFEYKMNPNARPGKGKFVAAFGSSNLGDVSPNIMGAKCINQDGWPACHEDSTCGPLHLTKFCIAFGPGKNGDNEESTQIIGERQFRKAEQLFGDKEGSEQLSGPVQFKHQFLNMTEYEASEESMLSLKYGFIACSPFDENIFDMFCRIPRVFDSHSPIVENTFRKSFMVHFVILEPF
jgi:neutral ceramidase